MQYLNGITAGTLITGGGPYRASWVRNAAAVTAAEVASVGWVDTSMATLAAKLDAALAGTGFYRGSPLAWSDQTITWDLVATTVQPSTGTTAAQAAQRLDVAGGAFLTLDQFGPRARVTGEVNRERARATTDATAQAHATASNPFTNFWNGIKAFGLTTALLAGAGLAAYVYLTTRPLRRGAQ